jgi:hypothetical protein
VTHVSPATHPDEDAFITVTTQRESTWTMPALELTRAWTPVGTPSLPHLTEGQWASVHGAEAESQGWGLFASDTRGLEIEADDSAGIFDGDDQALLYVQRQAKRGTVCAVEALRIVAEAQAHRSAFNGFNPEAAERTLLAIQDALDGKTWTPDTTMDIARLMIAAGYEIREA